MKRLRLVIVFASLACGPGKSTSDETGAADGSWTGAGGTSGTSTGASGATGPASTSASCEDGCGSGGATVAPEGDLPPPGGPCDAWAQDCPEGQKCTFYGEDGGPMWDATLCAPLPDDPGRHGEPCTVDLRAGNDTCDKGHVCMDADPDTHVGTCKALCTGSFADPQCPPAMHCILARTWNFCALDCNPLLQDCGDGETCVLDFDVLRFVCLPDQSGEEGQAFDPCLQPNGCDPGLFCYESAAVSPMCDVMTVGCCTPSCDTDEPDCPGPGQSCVGLFEPGTAPPEFATLGLCRL